MSRLVIFLTFFLFGSVVHAAELRLALVIGNSKYTEFGTLENPVKDAKGMSQALKEMGYTTKLVLDADESTMRREVKRFAAASQGADVALVYYAGHGSQVGGENYLLPVDLELPKVDTDIQLSSIKVDDVINSLKSKVKIFLLDACRDNPVLAKNLVKGRGSYRGGLAPVNSTIDASSNEGVFIAYSTDSGNTASDGTGNQNSPFTAALLKNIKSPVSIDDMFSMVTREVKQKTGNKQRPYKYASLEGIFCIPLICGSNQNKSGFSEPKEFEADKEKKYPEILANNIWVEIDNDLDSFYFYDPKSILKNNSRVKIKTMSYRYTNPIKLSPLDSVSITEWSHDCTNNKYYMTQVDVTLYDNPIASHTWGKWETMDTNSQSPIKGTIGELIYSIACLQLTPPVIEADNLERFFSMTLDNTNEKDQTKSIYYYSYDKSSVRKNKNSASVNFRASTTNPENIIKDPKANYGKINSFYEQFKNSYSDARIEFNCKSMKLPTYYSFNYSNKLSTPLNVIKNENIDIFPGGYFDILRETVCKN